MHTSPIQAVLSHTGDYDELAEQGLYSDAPQGLRGKYDTVRRYWENQITRCIAALAVRRARCSRMRGDRWARVLDLGFGSGEGWERLTGARSSEPGARLFSPGEVDCYPGDRSLAGDNRHGAVAIRRHAARQLRGRHLAEPAAFLCEGYDLYFNSYEQLRLVFASRRLPAVQPPDSDRAFAAPSVLDRGRRALTVLHRKVRLPGFHLRSRHSAHAAITT